jgi:hypothetical protein
MILKRAWNVREDSPRIDMVAVVAEHLTFSPNPTITIQARSAVGYPPIREDAWTV